MPKNVSSLDSDLSELRASKYDGASTAEVSAWISTVIGEELPKGEDLMDTLRDGTILCKLANTIKPGCATSKKSSMPFVQMENIASFLKAASFLGVPQHELFETVDMYELRDPAQILVCLKALSRHAHKVNPDIPVMGPKLGTPSPNAGKKNFKADTSGPAWNTHQYGYLGGASQGSEKLVFGGRRDIMTDEKTEESKKININFGSGGSGGSNDTSGSPATKKGPPPIPSKPKHLKGFDQGEHEEDEDDEVEDMKLHMLKSKQQTAQAVEEYDASVYAYDDVYEDMHNTKPEPKTQLTQSKHLDSLLEAKRKREEDRLVATEVKLKRQRANEGDLYDDKEKFVTPAYKRQQEALKKEREKEAKESRSVSSFYDTVEAMAGKGAGEETSPVPTTEAPTKSAPQATFTKPKPLPVSAPAHTEKMDKVAAARARFLERKKGIK